jgi:hypothetical protein
MPTLRAQMDKQGWHVSLGVQDGNAKMKLSKETQESLSFFSCWIIHYITTNEMKLVKKHKQNPNKKKNSEIKRQERP